MRTLRGRKRRTISLIAAASLAGALLGGLIGLSTNDPVLFWVWLSVTAALGAVIAAAPVLSDPALRE